MPDKWEAFQILLFLLPGFTTAYLVEMLAVRKKHSELEKVVEALIFSLVIYLITFISFGNVFPVIWNHPDATHAQAFAVVHWWHLWSVVALSCIFGLLYAANLNHDWFTSIITRLRISNRSSRANIWNDTFQELGGYVEVGLSGNRKVVGWVRDYSDEVDIYELLLEDAVWLDEKGNEVETAGTTILLTKKSGITYVAFLGDGISEIDDGADDANKTDDTTPGS